MTTVITEATGALTIRSFFSAVLERKYERMIGRRQTYKFVLYLEVWVVLVISC